MSPAEREEIDRRGVGGEEGQLLERELAEPLAAVRLTGFRKVAALGVPPRELRGQRGQTVNVPPGDRLGFVFASIAPSASEPALFTGHE